ncbi:MAG TPA: zf-HC2 domain-containing protein [Vicinamibacterales bacterium]|jgi:anti-sigma factor RsiW
MSDECRHVSEQLTSYVDEQLDTTRREEVERHLDECASCRSAVARERGGQTVLRHHAQRLREEPLPPGLRSRCESLVHEHTSATSVAGWRRTLVPTVLSVILLVFTASAIFSLATRRSDAVLAAQLTADHSKCFKLFVAGNPPEMDAHEVEEMLTREYGWKIHVPPSVDGLQLVGARRCLYADGLIPHVMYRAADGQDLSLFVLNGVTRNPSELVTFGHRSQIWTKNNTTFVLVGPSDESGRLADATRYVMKEAER